MPAFRQFSRVTWPTQSCRNQESGLKVMESPRPTVTGRAGSNSDDAPAAGDPEDPGAEVVVPPVDPAALPEEPAEPVAPAEPVEPPVGDVVWVTAEAWPGLETSPRTPGLIRRPITTPTTRRVAPEMYVRTRARVRACDYRTAPATGTASPPHGGARPARLTRPITKRSRRVRSTAKSLCQNRKL